jgi:hypothetical protein
MGIFDNSVDGNRQDSARDDPPSIDGVAERSLQAIVHRLMILNTRDDIDSIDVA